MVAVSVSAVILLVSRSPFSKQATAEDAKYSMTGVQLVIGSVSAVMAMD